LTVARESFRETTTPLCRTNIPSPDWQPVCALVHCTAVGQTGQTFAGKMRRPPTNNERRVNDKINLLLRRLRESLTPHVKNRTMTLRDCYFIHVRGSVPVDIQVCIGSGCHIKGAHFVINRLKQLVSDHQSGAGITLRASFCQEHCTEGVVVRINGTIIKRVTVDNVEAHFLAAVSRQ